MKNYKRLSLDEREEISRMLAQNYSFVFIWKIAKEANDAAVERHIVASLINGPTSGNITGAMPAGNNSYTWKVDQVIQGDVAGNIQPGNHRIKIILYDSLPCLGLCPVSSTAQPKIIAQDTSDAAFSIILETFTLTVIKSGAGSGTITSSPIGINCGSDCTESYASGTSIILTATPAEGSTFTSWSGEECSDTKICTLSIIQNRNVTATFNITNHTPIAVAAISEDNSNYTDVIIVTRGVPTPIYLSAAGSSGPNGWTDPTNGVSSGGKCEWNSDLNQGSPTFKRTITNPASPSICNISLGSLTFNDTPGTYTYQVLKITDKPGAVSNIDTVSVTVQAPPFILGPGDYDFSLVHDGLTRTYKVYVPSSYDKTKSMPLVIALHGGGGSGRGMIELTHFNDISEPNEFIAVYPDGYIPEGATERSWADGRGVTKADKAGIDDVGFISALIDDLSAKFNIDTRKVYSTGMSNGGMMTQTLGCKLSDKLAAIAPVAGNMAELVAPTCSPARPLSVLHIHGTTDIWIPWDGGYVTLRAIRDYPLLGIKCGDILGTQGRVISTQVSINKWLGINGCLTSPADSTIDPVVDGTSIIKHVYGSCQNNNEVILYEVIEGGHGWPGGLRYWPECAIGKTSQDIDASAVIWEFFKKHSIVAATGAGQSSQLNQMANVLTAAQEILLKISELLKMQ